VCAGGGAGAGGGGGGAPRPPRCALASALCLVLNGTQRKESREEKGNEIGRGQ
jgi:hypothetical protein